MVGDFVPDPAIVSKSEDGAANGQPRLGSHGIRVGDVVRVNDVSAGGKKVGKDKDKDGKDVKGAEGVVTRTGDRAIWIAFGSRGGGGRSKEEDEAIEELWGKKLWAWVFPDLDIDFVRFADLATGSNLPMMLRIDGMCSMG